MLIIEKAVYVLLTSLGYSSTFQRTGVAHANECIWLSEASSCSAPAPVFCRGPAASGRRPAQWHQVSKTISAHNDARPGSPFHGVLSCHAQTADCGSFLSWLLYSLLLLLVSLLIDRVRDLGFVPAYLPHPLDCSSGKCCSTPGSNP